MTVHFFLPNGNRIDIEDRGSGGRPNGVLDGSDLIRINRETYTLDEVMRFPESSRLIQSGDAAGSWRFLMRELGIGANPQGINLSQASRVFGLREQARFLLAQPSSTAEQRRIIQSFIFASNQIGFPALFEPDLRSLSACVPASAFPRWSAMECLIQSGWVYCSAGAPTSEQAQIREALENNRRIRVVIGEKLTEPR